MNPNLFIPALCLLLAAALATGSYWLLGYWLLAAIVSGYSQGRLMPTLRAVPEADPAAARNSQALHLGLGLAYFLPALPLAGLPGLAWWAPLALAVLVRAALFDAALNLACGYPLLYVGNTAALDRFGRWLVAKPWQLAAFKVLCLLGAVLLTVIK